MGASEAARRQVPGGALRGIVLVSLIVAGCSAAPAGPTSSPSTGPTSAPTDTAAAPSLDPAAARIVLEAADPADPPTIDAVEAIRFSAAGTQAARATLESGATSNALWAATYVYASLGEDPAPLRPLVSSEDASVRVMAGAALLSLGERAGFDPLVAALTDRTLLTASEPPQEVWTFATSSLVRYAGGRADVPAADAADADLAAAQAAWSEWLAANGAALTFNPATRTWSGP